MRERGERPTEAKAPNPLFEEEPRYPEPINWWTLDPDERAETLTALFGWVQELVRRYSLTAAHVPPCWYRHEAVVQELLALYQYREMQFLPVAPASAPLDFHYQFSLALNRLSSWMTRTGCNSAEHSTNLIQPWSIRADADAATWEVDALEYVMSAQHDWATEALETSS